MSLQNCNLQTIPSDFGYWFSSLEVLDLRGTNLVSLPYSIFQLSQLTCTVYDDCLCPQYQSKPSASFSVVDSIQCGNLFLTHGSEIPKWFNNQRIGHKVNIQVPSCYGRDERMGIALCIVLVPDSTLYARDFWYKCSVEVKGCQVICLHLIEKNFARINSHLLGLQYLSHDILSADIVSNWKEVWSQSDANGICQIGIEISSPSLEVKKIGVRLVFEQEVDDPDQP